MHFSVAFVAFVATAWALVPAPLEERKADKGDEIVKLARKQLGVDYVLGGGNCQGKSTGVKPGVGFDCSGLNEFVVCKVVGTKIPGQAWSQYIDHLKGSGRVIKLADIQPGDMLYFADGGDCTKGSNDGAGDEQHTIKHTVIVSKKGKVITAPKTGDVVKEINYDPVADHSYGNYKVCPHAIRFWDDVDKKM
ncbi:hypothetical protein LTR56_020857 [Elasticomyces elasticus]|nr:hypothetical protein LTR56_020857 [Elasticomyces elasticus]KAK3652242.1 hypothetical protein LTR22_011743 [Elasticomyces elasticus]KAK4909935.1 hypothetical protein LTR49_021340 [Elasticomyces elasticus]KAK5751607.1 hypothetical protein LTS12_018312 [Elasticomyces elasticus]